MNDSTKMLIGTIAALAAFVAVFSIMASCAEQVAKVDGTAKAACTQGGGEWIDALDNSHVGQCVKVTK